MQSKRRHEGYLLIDHRNSPGVPVGFGGSCVAVGAGQAFEAATITCSHCQAIVVLNPERDRERAWCAKCDHYICDGCGAARECVPFAKTLDLAAEAVIRGQPFGGLIHGKT